MTIAAVDVAAAVVAVAVCITWKWPTNKLSFQRVSVRFAHPATHSNITNTYLI